jgi:putative toxin-antitoxin system antitoxin component (TIGR02293 family)
MTLYQLAAAPDLAQIKAIENGLPSSTIRDLTGEMHISRKSLVSSLGLAERTVALRARGKKRFSAIESERFLRVARALRLAREVFPNTKDASGWLKTPDVSLGNRIPLAMLVTDVGARKVENLLLGMIHGLPV